MHFDRPLIRLPIRFCADTLAAEVRALPPHAWIPHPQGFPGNEAVPLVTPGGRATNEFVGPMGPTDYLRHSPYLMEVMAAIGATWGRSRLMGLGAGAQVPEHVDNNYYWRTHIRFHIPVVTNPDVDFTCGDETVNMAAGSAWIFDTFRKHQVQNRGTSQRIHLVCDTVGGERLWDLVDAARSGDLAEDAPLFAPGQGSGEPLLFEQHNYPTIMSPWELRCHVGDVVDVAIDAPALGPVRHRLDRLIAGWIAAWSCYERDPAGIPTYRALLDTARGDLLALGAERVELRNGQTLYPVLDKFIFMNMIAADPRAAVAIPAELHRQAR